MLQLTTTTLDSQLNNSVNPEYFGLIKHAQFTKTLKPNKEEQFFKLLL